MGRSLALQQRIRTARNSGYVHKIFEKMKSLGVLLLYSLITLSAGLYFHIGETEKKCFIEEIPDETMVVGM